MVYHATPRWANVGRTGVNENDGERKGKGRERVALIEERGNTQARGSVSVEERRKASVAVGYTGR